MNLSCVFEKTTLPINKETIATLKPYIIMVKFIAPAFLLILLLQALGIVTF